MPYSRRTRDIEKIMEFKKTEPYIAMNLVSKIAEKKGEHLRMIMELREATKKIIREIDELGYSSKIVGISIKSDELEKLARQPLAGVDGSFQVVGGRGNTYYVMLTAVIVKLYKGVYSEKNEVKILYPENGIDVVSFNDPTYGEKTREIAEDIMMFYETSALFNVVEMCRENNECFNVYIDGPITDPPREPTPYGAEFLEKKYGVSDYIEFRVKPFLEAWNTSGHEIIVGYVKAPRNDRLLKENLRDMGISNSLLDKFSGDAELAKAILTELVHEAPRILGNEIYGYIGPLQARGGIYNKYSEKGLAVYYIYGINRMKNRVFRLEIGFPQGFRDMKYVEDIFEKTYRLSIASTLPGNNHPLPIVLAHKKCQIRKGAAEVIYEMILSNLLKDVLSKAEDPLEKRKIVDLLQEEELKY